jgi:AbrB family looped-hinge helix DNA binding protein
MNRSAVTTRGRVTIPKHIRDYLGLLPGDELRFEYDDDGAVRIVPPRKPAQGKGSRFDDFLKDEGIYAEVQARALRRALAEHVAETKRHRSFLDEAARADVAMQESGVGYAMPDVHAYVSAKVRGERVKRPSLVKWRK